MMATSWWLETAPPSRRPPGRSTAAATFGDVPPRPKHESIQQVHMDLAWLVQDSLESAMLELARNAHALTRADAICMSGGVTLNCVANQRILAETPFGAGYFQPACSDTGIPLGCALWGAHVVGGRDRFWTMDHAFLGPLWSAAAHEEALDLVAGESVRVTHYDGLEAIADATAKLMSRGKILGWYQGRSELGPRALGHRSIVCDPRRPRMKDILNEKVKHREFFRPFAPAVLEERANEYFDLAWPSPHMLLIADVRPEKRKEVPAITHVDGTARVQTVGADNAAFRALIEAFDAWASVPVILNTSFNVAGEPIVESPSDAVRCFLGTELDGLALGNVLVEKV